MIARIRTGRLELEHDYVIVFAAKTSYTLRFRLYQLWNVDEKGRVASGFAKWDGCVNLDWNNREGMFHYCGPEGALRLGRALALISELGELNHDDPP